MVKGKFDAMLVSVNDELNWGSLKHHDKGTAKLLAMLAPKIVVAALKLNKTRDIQAQSSAKRKVTK